jgi:hypothetical protein
VSRSNATHGWHWNHQKIFKKLGRGFAPKRNEKEIALVAVTGLRKNSLSGSQNGDCQVAFDFKG